MSLDELWLLTPWHFSCHVEAYNQRKEAERDAGLFMAWHMAAFSRTKKMPKLSKLFEKKAPKQKMSGNELKHTFKALLKK